MKKMSSLLGSSVFALSTILLSGCASIVNGTNQQIMIDTTPVTGARCYLQNDKGQWYLKNTPGAINVHRSYKDLLITTKKPGYQDSKIRIKSVTKGMVVGNAVFGGCIGVGIDCLSGAAYDYPPVIHVPMIPLNEKDNQNYCKK